MALKSLNSKTSSVQRNHQLRVLYFSGFVFAFAVCIYRSEFLSKTRQQRGSDLGAMELDSVEAAPVGDADLGPLWNTTVNV